MRRRLRPATPAPPRPGASLPGDMLLAVDINTPASVLVQLVERYRGGVNPKSTRPQALVLRACARHPNLPSAVFWDLALDYPWAALQNPKLPLLLLEDPTRGAFLQASLEPETDEPEEDPPAPSTRDDW